MDKENLTSQCGLDCYNCPLYEKNITEEGEKFAVEFYRIPAGELPCKGCSCINSECKLAVNNQCASWCPGKKGFRVLL